MAQIISHRRSNPALGVRSDQPEDLNAEITRVREDSIRLQAAVDSETTSLIPVYNDLAKRRALLKPGDQQATAAFNHDAAAYTARKKSLDAQRKLIGADQEQLSELLAKRTALASNPAGGDSSGVTLYGTQWCPACKMAKGYLESKGIAYRDVDVEHDTQGAAEFQRRGGGGVPMIVINGQQTTGFSSAWVDAHLR